MPVYDLLCKDCGTTEEVFLRRYQDLPPACSCGGARTYKPTMTNLGGGLTLVVDNPNKPGDRVSVSVLQNEAAMRGEKIRVRPGPTREYIDSIRHSMVEDYKKVGMSEADVRRQQETSKFAGAPQT